MNAMITNSITTVSSPLQSRREPSSSLPRLAAVGGSLYFFVHSLFVILGPEDRVMQWLYDDSFYYMITARHWSEAHLSSFDGVTLTSGYHPLWMWLCAGVYGLRGQLDLVYVRLCMSLALAITSIVLLLTLRHAWNLRRNGLLWTIGLATCSYSALNNGLTPMEWPLVLLCWFALHVTLIRTTHGAPVAYVNYAIAFLCGFAGSFSRTDFGLIPACYLAAAVLLARRHGNWLPVGQSLAATVGAAVALPCIFLYNRRVTGEWLQQSAQIKHVFATLTNPFNPVPAVWQFGRVLLYLPPLNLSDFARARALHFGLAAVLVAVIALGPLARKYGRSLASATPATTSPEQMHQFTQLASLLGVFGYLLLDSFNSQALFGWYSGSVTGFIVLLSASRLRRLHPSVAAIVVLPVMLLNIAAAQHFGGNARTQMDEIYIGRALHTDHPGAIAGGGDVGKPSFYNHGTMVNLDGLMNNEVVPYLTSGMIHCYVLHRRIEFLSDIGTITFPLTNAERARHGLPALPWNLYFRSIPISAADKSPANTTHYLKTNFDAIHASGECKD